MRPETEDHEQSRIQTGCVRPLRVLIIGGGFGGLSLALSLRRAPVDVTLVDRRNFHLFQPLLYQVATGGLSPANIASPLRWILRRQRNTTVVMGDVEGVDVDHRVVRMLDGELGYDILVAATGVKNDYFGNDAWKRHAPGLKTIEDAIGIRRRVLLAFEAAERETDPQRVREHLTFVVVGGGPTGVELAGALAEIARKSLRRDFRRIDSSDARILLVEGGDRLLRGIPPDLSAKAAAALERLGVRVRTGVLVSSIEDGRVKLKCGDEEEIVTARTVLWAAGVQASALGRALAEATGAELDKLGRVKVDPNLIVPNHPEIFVIGDLAHFSHGEERPLPGVAPVAMQQGHFVGKLIRRRLAGKPEPTRFRYRDRGSMATIGRAAAVVDLGWVRLSGFPAWLVWLFVHLLFLIEFQNRVLVLVQWMWNYLTWQRSARLITQVDDHTPVRGGGVDSHRLDD